MRILDKPNLHASPRTVDVILWVTREEVYCSCEFDVSALVVLLVEALSSESVVC